MNNDSSRVMPPGPPGPPGSNEPDPRVLCALVDGELSDAERAATLDRLAGDSRAATRVAAYRAQNDALKALFALSESGRCIVLRPRGEWRRRSFVAAVCLALGVAVGVMSSWVPLRFANDYPAFARRADVAYAVYAPEQRHPVEVAAAQEAQLTQWLSRRLGRPLSVPSLLDYGYSLVGGRLLPGESGPAAQFMYQNAAGNRLTLYVTLFPKNLTVFRLFRDGDRSTFYWVNDGMGYALSGQIAAADLRSIALDVCGELGGNPRAWQTH